MAMNIIVSFTYVVKDIRNLIDVYQNVVNDQAQLV